MGKNLEQKVKELAFTEFYENVLEYGADYPELMELVKDYNVSEEEMFYFIADLQSGKAKIDTEWKKVVVDNLERIVLEEFYKMFDYVDVEDVYNVDEFLFVNNMKLEDLLKIVKKLLDKIEK